MARLASLETNSSNVAANAAYRQSIFLVDPSLNGLWAPLFCCLLFCWVEAIKISETVAEWKPSKYQRQSSSIDCSEMKENDKWPFFGRYVHFVSYLLNQFSFWSIKHTKMTVWTSVKDINTVGKEMIRNGPTQPFMNSLSFLNSLHIC